MYVFSDDKTIVKKVSKFPLKSMDGLSPANPKKNWEITKNI